MLHKRLTVIALVALTLACGGDDRPILKVGTDGTSFQRASVPSTATSPIAFVPYTTWNRGNATAFIRTCGGRARPVIEELVNGQWESYASGFCLMDTVMEPIEIRAGGTHRDEVAIGDAGRFRIRMPYSADAQSSKPFDTVSLPFDVH